MELTEVKSRLNTVVKYKGKEYYFTGCTIRKNQTTNETFYQAELADIHARSVMITKLSDVNV